MNTIVSASSEFVRNLFGGARHPEFVYHNIAHTEEVAASAEEIGNNTKLTAEEMEILLIAAWFHDTGYMNIPENHEEESIKICREFLQANNYPAGKMERVLNAIMATKLPYSPKNKLEEILCDADLSHAGKKGFNAKSKHLRLEWEKTAGRSFNDFEWIKTNIDFLSGINYYTEYAKDKYTAQKDKNLEKLKKKLRETLEQETVLSGNPINTVPEEKLLDLEMDKNAKRGIETMFRNTIRTHVEFSSMADSKANIMISVNTLIITAAVALMGRTIPYNPGLVVPVTTLVISSLITLVFAILVTRPKITEGTFSAEDIKEKRANLLFFGNFFNMPLKDFQWGMSEMIRDSNYLYGSMIKDFYFLGQVLGQKYRYLRICYNIFIVGIILTVISYVFVLLSGKAQMGPN